MFVADASLADIGTPKYASSSGRRLFSTRILLRVPADKRFLAGSAMNEETLNYGAAYRRYLRSARNRPWNAARKVHSFLK
jgi:hypothetical protein